MITLKSCLKRWQLNTMMQSMNLKRNEKNERSFKKSLIIMKREQLDKFERLVKEIDLKLCFKHVSFKLKKYLRRILVILSKHKWNEEFGKKKLVSCWMNIRSSWRVCKTSTCKKWHKFIKRIFQTSQQSMKFYKLITKKSNQRKGTLMVWNLQEIWLQLNHFNHQRRTLKRSEILKNVLKKCFLIWTKERSLMIFKLTLITLSHQLVLKKTQRSMSF